MEKICRKGEESTASEITANIVHGSSIGAESYVVNTADLKAVTPGNRMIKFADDTGIPAANARPSRQAELDSVSKNGRGRTTIKSTLTDKRLKTVEHPPAPMPNIKRVYSISITGRDI